MGFGVTELLILLLIVALLFGTKKLRGLGSDVGGAVKGFKTAMQDDKKDSLDENDNAGQVIEGKVEQDEKQDQ